RRSERGPGARESGTMSGEERRQGRTRDEVREKLFELVLANARIDRDSLKEEARLDDDLRMDSLDLISVVNEVEPELKITIPDDQLGKLKTVKEVVDALWGRLGEKKA